MLTVSLMCLAHIHTWVVTPQLQDPTIRLMIDVLDLVGPVRASDPAGSEPQRSLLKAIKFLLKEDAANYRRVFGL